VLASRLEILPFGIDATVQSFTGLPQHNGFSRQFRPLDFTFAAGCMNQVTYLSCSAVPTTDMAARKYRLYIYMRAGAVGQRKKPV
jgi:hypothetical protein